MRDASVERGDDIVQGGDDNVNRRQRTRQVLSTRTSTFIAAFHEPPIRLQLLRPLRRLPRIHR